MDSLNTYTQTQTPNVPHRHRPKSLTHSSSGITLMPLLKKKKEKHVLVHDQERICLDTGANIIVMHFLLAMMPRLPLFSLFIG